MHTQAPFCKGAGPVGEGRSTNWLYSVANWQHADRIDGRRAAPPAAHPPQVRGHHPRVATPHRAATIAELCVASSKGHDYSHLAETDALPQRKRVPEIDKINQSKEDKWDENSMDCRRAGAGRGGRGHRRGNGGRCRTTSAGAGQAAYHPGYLETAQLPDSLIFIPPPPAEGSPSLARDHEASQRGLALRGTARWDLATTDADLFTPKDTDALSCAAGFAIGPDTAPATNRVLRRATMDFAMSTGAVKKKHQRARPFMENGQPTCTPAHESFLRKDGSYPSGHSAVGYGWSLVLAELLPIGWRR